MFIIVKVVLQNLCAYANLPIILSLNACVSLSKGVLRYDGLMVSVCLAAVAGLLILLFESIHALGLSVLVRNSTHPCKVVGLLPGIYVHIVAICVCVAGE